jgi:hypothetical protein
MEILCICNSYYYLNRHYVGWDIAFTIVTLAASILHNHDQVYLEKNWGTLATYLAYLPTIWISAESVIHRDNLCDWYDGISIIWLRNSRKDLGDSKILLEISFKCSYSHFLGLKQSHIN